MTPGGIVWKLSVLLTTTVIRACSPARDVLGHVGLERRVAALVGDDLGVVHPDRRPVGRGLEVQHDPLPVPAARHPDGGLVPDVAEVVAHRRVGGDVVEAGRYGHLPGVRAAGRGTTPPPGPRRPGRGANRHSPLSDFRSRVAVSCGRSIRVPPSPSTGWDAFVRAWRSLPAVTGWR